MKRKLPEKFFEQNQRAKTRKWKFFNLNQALWGAGNREFRTCPPTDATVAVLPMGRSLRVRDMEVVMSFSFRIVQQAGGRPG